MSNDMKIRDASIARVYESLNKNQITQADAEKLVAAANDGNTITSLEKEELGWILHKHQDSFSPEARAHLARTIGLPSEGPVAQPTLTLKDAGLRRELAKVLADDKITKPEVFALIENARDGGTITATERADLFNILNRLGDQFDGDARQAMADFLGVRIAPEPPPVTPLKTVSSLRGNTWAIKDLKEFPDKFRADLEAAKAELVGHPSLNDDQKADRMLEFFKPYGERFHMLSKNASGAQMREAMTSVENQLKEVGYNAILNRDDDKDGLTMAQEIMRGTDPNRYSAVADTQSWSTTYWPMGGNLHSTAGDPSKHLWADRGVLSKLDQLNTSRGNERDARALEFERKPALNWLIGSQDTGHYIPNSTLREDDAERTTGVDFDGDGKITAGVKVDFLDRQGNFAAVSNIRDFVPKLDGETLTRRMVGEGDNKEVKYFRQDGSEISAADRARVVLTNPRADGSATNTMDVSWWGSCDKVALAGVLFEQPVKDSVTVDGVTFTKQDMLGLLTVIADSQARGTDFVGNRYDDRPDILVLKDGRQIQGKMETTGVEFERSDMWRWQGDYMVLNSVDKEIRIKNFATGEVETYPADQIRHLAREDKKDVEASKFHHTVMDWLKSGRAAAMDREPGSQVWNYNFWKAERAEVPAPRHTNLEQLRGFNGEIKNTENLKFYEADLHFGDSTQPRTYRYWIETDSRGKEINSGWLSENPDFLWRPAGFNNWSGSNSRNPFVKPELVKEIYDKFFE